MKKINKKFVTVASLSLVLILAVLLWAAETQKTSPAAKKIATFKYKDLVWQVPQVGKEVKRVELKNGMIVYLKEDHTLPLFNVQVLINTGAVYEPAQKAGLAQLTGTVLRTGGTKSLKPDEINQKLEYMAGSVETSIGTEAGRASLSILSKDTDESLKLLADILRNPTFNKDKLQLVKDQLKEQIRRRNDTPGSIINREFYKTIYGDHPYGRSLEWDNIKSITQKELAGFHQKYFQPHQIMLGISGDFKEAEILQKLEKVFGDWQKKEMDYPSKPKVEKKFKPGIYFIEKEINQTNIMLGHLGTDLNNPDQYALSLMNFILGGGSFTSRLTSRVRSDEGLAYSVGSSFPFNTQDLGVFFASCQTKTKSTCRALGYMLDEIKNIRQSPVTEEELNIAKDAYINNFVFRFTTTEQIVGLLMGLEYDKRPADYYKNYLDNIRKVSAKDILRVAQQYLHPESLTIYVVGHKADFDQSLEELGEVTEIALVPPQVD